MKGLRKITGAGLLRATAFAVAGSLSLTGCSGGPGEDNVPGRSDRLRVLTSVRTRSAVDGTALPRGSAIGAVVTTEDGSAYFTPSATAGGTADGGYYADGRNVRFTNGTDENTWTPTTEEGKTKLLLFAGADKGKVYGYYPWTSDADIKGEGASAMVPVRLLSEGTIVVDDGPGRGTQDGVTAAGAYTAADDIDYMYSSRSDEVGTGTTTTASLVMEHVLSYVSFRLYASADTEAAVEGDEDSYYEFVGYTLRNRSGWSELVAGFDENTRMKVADGTITGAVPGGEIVRRIEGYRMVRSNGNTPEADNTAAAASPRVGNLCFPVKSISHDGRRSTRIEAVFEVRRMRGDGTLAAEPAGYVIPLAVVPGESDRWQAGKHYTYTVKFTGRSLPVESVTVTDWTEVPGGDMNIAENPYVNSAEVSPPGDIPGGGGTCDVILEGVLPYEGVEVRACSGGKTLAAGTAAASGEAVSLRVPANESYDARTVAFEYNWNGEWTPVAERTQSGCSVSSAETNAPAPLPGDGGTYSVTLTGALPYGGVEVRAGSGGKVLVTGTAKISGKAVWLAVPANESYHARTVAFEYKWNDAWTPVAERTQGGYSITSAATNVPAAIPGDGGTYSVTLEGYLPSEGVEVRARSGGKDLVTGTATTSGEAVSLRVPANRTGGTRTVVFEYKWNGEWVQLGEERSQAHTRIGESYGGGVIYWVNPDDANDFRVVALDEASTKWAPAPSSFFMLGPGARDRSARNGADVWKIAKSSSEEKKELSGVFGTDYPAFGLCYEKTDGGVAKGTWYLPSLRELEDLYSAKGTVEPFITAHGGTAFTGKDYWSATEYDPDSSHAWIKDFVFGNTMTGSFNVPNDVRCVRSK